MSTYYKRSGVDGDLPFGQISLSTQLILSTAKEQGIKCTTIPHTGLVKLSYKGSTEYVHAQPPSLNTRTAVYCCSNKAVTKSILKSHGISVATGLVIKKSDGSEYWSSVYESLTKPLVVKPIDSSLAKNVFANISSKREYLTAIHNIFKYYGATSQDPRFIKRKF